MLTTTLSRLRCLCGQPISEKPAGPAKTNRSASPPREIRTGQLLCTRCKASYWILGGVALLVEDAREYILTHVKGISKLVGEAEIPAPFREEFSEAKAELQTEHIEDDLEADRVIALYLMNHYLRVRTPAAPVTDVESPTPSSAWWKPRHGEGSPVIDALIREHWDRGPLARIAQWAEKRAKTQNLGHAVELGCGVGGLHSALSAHCESYLGVDSSFASIALARHLALGVPYPGALRIPEDLLRGPISREIQLPIPTSFTGQVDFVVGDLERPPLARGEWNLTLALNAIDMLEEPAKLPRLQHDLLAPGGTAIQSCPYIWHEIVAKQLRAKIPKSTPDSAAAVEWLYEKAGLKITEREMHLPWLFFKHARQLEIYSVHWFSAEKKP